MKSRWKLWGLVALAMLTAVIAYANGGQNITSTINTARFILFGGSYTISETRTENGVFKLDTYSGKTWILRAAIENGNRIERWEPVPEADAEPAAIKQSTSLPKL
jgi:hypothetical protein